MIRPRVASTTHREEGSREEDYRGYRAALAPSSRHSSIVPTIPPGDTSDNGRDGCHETQGRMIA